jgi:hypothetical protein
MPSLRDIMARKNRSKTYFNLRKKIKLQEEIIDRQARIIYHQNQTIERLYAMAMTNPWNADNPPMLFIP